MVEKKMAKKARMDYLPALGQKIMRAMALDAVASVKKGQMPESKCVYQIMNMVGIPAEFARRWSEERAIEDIMRKACEYGLTGRVCTGHWRYLGPEVVAQRKKQKDALAAKKKAILAFVKSKGVSAKADDIGTGYGPNHNATTVRVTLPKHLWLGV